MVERKRDHVTRALVASWTGKALSINADSWPGVVLSGDGWRVVLSRDACRYRLQQRRPGSTKWERVYGPASPLEWGRFQPLFPDLPEKAAGLPADPTEAALALVAAHAVPVPAAQRLRYWSAPDYSGVLAVSGNMRAVRDRTGRLYAVQWVKPGSLVAGGPVRWITQHKGPAWPPLVDQLAGKTVLLDCPTADRAEKRALLAALFDGFPESAADGPWPVVEVQPSQRRARRQSRPAVNISSETRKRDERPK